MSINEKYKIIPGVGFGFLKFGMSLKDVEDHLGGPEEIENPDEEGDIIYSYENKGIDFLAFSKEDDFRLTMIELNSKSEAILWENKIFGQTIEQIKKLSNTMGYSLKFEDSIKDDETSECFLEQYTIHSLSIDFYFNQYKVLETICFGVSFNENDEIEWPE